MKNNIKTFTLFIILSFTAILLVSCNVNKEIDFNYEVLHHYSGFSFVGKSEYSDYIYDNFDDWHDNRDINRNFKDKYNERFFNKNILVVLDIGHNYGSVDKPVFTIDKIEYQNNELNIEVSHYYASLSEITVFMSYIFIEIEKSELPNKKIDKVNTIHLDTFFYQLYYNIPETLYVYFKFSKEGTSMFRITYDGIYYSGTFKMKISNDFDTVEIYDMSFDSDTPNSHNLSTKGKLTNFQDNKTFVYNELTFSNNNW